MKKLNVAIIGHGRSGRGIHGKYFKSELNKLFTVKYIVDVDERRRAMAKEMFPEAEVLADYTELFDKEVDLITNATYSNDHYRITKDLLEHGKNVMSEKPFGRSYFECSELIRTAERKGVVLAVFHNTQPAPFYVKAKEVIASGILGDITEISIRYNGYARRWDWQTLQWRLGGSLYNTGPHPVAMALGFYDFDEKTQVKYSKLSRMQTSGDAEDFVKIILGADGRPPIDIEISSTDPYTDYTLKIQGSHGCFKATAGAYKMKYRVEGENPQRKVEPNFIYGENFEPVFCSEKLVMHEEEGSFEGNAMDVGVDTIYTGAYDRITGRGELAVSNEMARQVVSVIEAVHSQNRLEVKYIEEK